jgi:EAL domain-containing protein (putative c-di-GMP-specific phosphodiesterase class I)
MKERAARRGAIEEGLRDALQNGGLFVAYQPIVSLAGGRCTGVEALVRWRQGARVVPPSEFIPVAEEVGLIGAVGEHVLREACAWFADVRARLGEAAPAYLSVNLSRAQLAQPEIVALVAQVLAASGVPGERLQLEVTETLAAQDAQANARLRELKALGVRIALDDFGTGFSSLACLHQLPVDVVKIDRSFVEEAETSEHRRVLVEATVRVAASLGMDTVVEGVETAAQARILRQLGCTSAQGYLFARPMPAGELERWLGGAPALLAVSA